MASITFKDLRYKRDKLYHDKVLKTLEKIKKETPAISSFLTESMSNFYKLLSAAIRIDTHPNVKMILSTISAKYETEIVMHVFLYEANSPKAMCTNRRFVHKGKLKSELIVLVSQHFFNNLDFQQQISVLSHELCHKLLGHTDLPAKRILESGIDLSNYRDLRLDLIKWLICAEISSDIFALHSTDYNPKVFSTSIIKYSSGVFALDSYDLINILLNQYEELSNNLVAQDLTPHPILPLRIKIIQEVCKDPIIKSIGKSISKDEKTELINNFNNKIDELIFAVYPEIFNESREEHILLYLNLGVAVILADEKITPEEERHFMSLSGERVFPGPFLEGVKIKLAQSNFKTVISELLLESVEYCKENKLRMNIIIPAIRFMILTAAADGVEAIELKVVYRFAKHFGITKEEIIMLLNQVVSQTSSTH